MGEAKRRKAVGTYSTDVKVHPFYHVTTPENLPLILEGGFKDHAATRGILDIITHQFEPGVWLADVPPITAISVDQYFGHSDEAWIEVMATEEFYWQHMRGNEWQEESWPLRQWLIPAVAVNTLPRREIPLVEVLAMRIANDTTEHHRFYTADILREQIETELVDGVRERWRAALETAANNLTHLQCRRGHPMKGPEFERALADWRKQIEEMEKSPDPQKRATAEANRMLLETMLDPRTDEMIRQRLEEKLGPPKSRGN
jgi:hypothetical protein